MLQDNNSTILNLKNQQIFNPETGEFTHNIDIEVKEFKNRRLRARGERQMYIKEGSVLDKTLCETNPAVVLSVCRSVHRDGVLYYNQEELAEKLKMSSRTVKRAWNVMKKNKLIHRYNKKWLVNPYAVLPYNIKDEEANKLQQRWDALKIEV